LRNAPYRERSRAVLVVRGEPFATFVLWAVWSAEVVIVAVALFVHGETRLRWAGGAVLSALVLATAVVVAGRSVARWRFSLAGSTLRIEHLTARHVDVLATLDVCDGVELHLQDAKSAGSLDYEIRLVAGDQRLEFSPGRRVDLVAARLTRFLEKHHVRVTPGKA
jgi:hypothetical protein